MVFNNADHGNEPFISIVTKWFEIILHHDLAFWKLLIIVVGFVATIWLWRRR